MTSFKSKIVASVLSICLLLSMGTGGLFTATASTLPSSADTLVAKLNQVYGYLTDAQKTDIRNAREDILDILIERNHVSESQWLTSYGSISQPLWTIVEAKKSAYLNANPTADLSALTEFNLLEFALHFGIIHYDPTFEALETYRTYGPFRDLMNQLAILGGLDGGLNDLDFGDLTDFYLDIETATRTTVANMPSFTSFTDLVSFKNALQTQVQNVLTAEGTNMAKILNQAGITGNALLDTKLQLQLKVTTALAAELALAKAYQAMIKATTSTSPPATDPVVTPPVQLPTQAAQQAQQKIDELKEKLADLPANEKKTELRAAEKEVAKAVKEAAKVTLPVVVTAGTAKPTIDTTSVVNQAKAAKQQADQLNGELQSIGAKKAKVEVTLDLGSVEADKTEVDLGSGLLQELDQEGIDQVAVSVNGVEVALSPNEFSQGATLSIEKSDSASLQQTTNKPVVSDVYTFEFTSGGETITSFNKPVELRLPVADTSDVDTDLLTIAKIVNDRLEYYGGIYNADTNTFNAKRNSFSSYVVVENRVTFDDTASVDSWAGVSIAVAAAKGVIVGDGLGSFHPTANVTRAEFAKMLVTAFSLTNANATESFSDVRDGDWFQSYVAAAAVAGIINGRSATIFDPNAPVSRQEMATMIARALKLVLEVEPVENPNAVLAGYTDAGQILASLKADVAITVDEGVMNGFNSQFNPLGNASRAEAAVVIKNLIDLL